MLRSPEELPTSEGVTTEKLGKWPVTVSTRMATEEGKYNAEVKEDKAVKFEFEFARNKQASIGGQRCGN